MYQNANTAILYRRVVGDSHPCQRRWQICLLALLATNLVGLDCEGGGWTGRQWHEVVVLTKTQEIVGKKNINSGHQRRRESSTSVHKKLNKYY